MITEKILAFFAAAFTTITGSTTNKMQVRFLNELQTFYFIIKTQTHQSISVKLFKAQ